MAKRTATTELNHENWDNDEVEEHPGHFVPLKSSELKDRVIRKAKRSLNKDSQSSEASSSPFAAFSGFKANPSSFSFLPKITTDSKSSSTDSPKTLTVPKEKNGDPAIKQPESSEDTSRNPIMNEAKPARSVEYYRQLQSLNKSVLNWIQQHLDMNSCSDFTPVFNDYKKYIDTLNQAFPIKMAEIKSPDVKTSGFFKQPVGSENIEKTSSDVNSSKSSKKDDDSSYGAHFASNTTNTSTFSFGIQSTPTATSSMPSSGPTSSSKEEVIKQGELAPEFSAGFFKQNTATAKPFSFACEPMKSSVSGNQDEEYVPPKNEFVAVQEDSIYSKRCKMFFKKDEGYSEKGVGTLHLKSLEGKTQLLIRADTSLGNILLNIMLTSSLPMSRTGKNNVLIVCVPNPPLDAKKPDSKEAVPILLRVKTSEDADELLEILNKHKS